MRFLRNQGVVFMCLGIAVAARADLSPGTWQSTRTGSSTWSGSFDPGTWSEYLINGQHGQPGNELTAFGENYYLSALLDTVTPLGSNGGLDGYRTVYGDVIFELYSGPWDPDPAANHDVTMNAITVESWKDDTHLEFSMSGDGYLAASPTIGVSVEATFDSLVNSYYASIPWEHGGDIGSAKVTVTPVPGAFLLGAVGLSFAGWRLKRKTV